MKDIVNTIRKKRKIIAWSLAALFIYTAAGFFVAPLILKPVLVSRLAENLHRDVSMAKIQFNPFTLSLRITDFTVRERESPETFVSFSELYADIQAMSIFKRGIIMREVRLRSPFINIVYNADRRYNFSDLMVKDDTKPEEEEEPFRFSLNNISITDGSIDFSDGPKETRHKVRDISIAVPFLSNLPYHVETFIQPQFQATVNDTPVALAGRTKPFADSLESRFDIDIKDFDIPYYLAYVPFEMKYSLQSGRMDAVIAVSFNQHPGRQPSIGVNGAVTLQEVKAQDSHGRPLISLPFFGVSIDTPDVMKKSVHLHKVFIDSPVIIAARAADGTLNLQSLVPDTQQKAPEGKKSGGEASFRLDIDEIQVKEGALAFEDHAVDGAFSTRLEQINIKATDFSTARGHRTRIEASLHTDSKESLKLAGGIILEPLSSEGTIEVGQVPVGKYVPYYRKAILFDITGGSLDVSSDYAVRVNEDETSFIASGLSARLDSLTLKKRGEEDEFLVVPAVSMKGASVDVSQKEISIGSFSTGKGMLKVRRYSDGKINLAELVSEAPQGAQKAEAGQTEKPWNISVKDLLAENYTVKFEDLAATEPVMLSVGRISLKGTGISTAENEKGKFALSFSFQDKGSVSAEGTMGINPFIAQARLSIKDFEIGPFQPYVADKVKLLVTSGAVQTDGTLTVSRSRDENLAVNYRGEASVVRFASVDRASAEDFLKWNSLYFGNMDIGYGPLLSVSINEVALSDFYSRVIVYPEGTLNVQDVMSKEGPADEDSSEEKAGEVPSDKKDANVTIGKITLQGGEINFTDNHIEPHYSANLLEIGGRISGLTSEENTFADVDLRGRLDNYAPFEITGKINPLVRDMFVDLRVDFKNIDLSPVTSYSGKYVGYTIEKGKLTLGLKYLIADRKLDAENSIFFDQLTFGERTESPEATKLPVKLAVALLKNRKGEINLDLPVSGDLDDPDFHLGRIIVKLLMNLLLKAATSPFALIGSLLGGGEELSVLEFDYGMSEINEEGRKKLDTLIKALYDRPALKLEIAGYVDTDKDREGLRQYLFDRKIKAQKLLDMIKKGEQAIPVDEVEIKKEEYENYLLKAYREEEFPKPRNFFGMLKKLPVPEMEKLMLTHIQLKDSDLKALAAQRAAKVKDYILRSEQVEPGRVFLVEPGTMQPEKNEEFRNSRVEFSLR